MQQEEIDSLINTSRFQVAEPAKGYLVPLRTKAELHAKHETINAYVCHVPLKDTGKVLSALKTFPNQATVDLHHLRRVVKREYRPLWLQQRYFPRLHAQVQCSYPESHNGSLHVSSPRLVDHVETVHILLVPVSCISREDILKILQRHLPHLFCSDGPKADPLGSAAVQAPQDSDQLLVVPVPLHPPTSYSDALKQSQTLWPTVYNPNTAYGPNAADVASAQLETGRNAAYFIALARKVAQEAKEHGRGEPIGVVVVESLNDSEDDSVDADSGKSPDLTNDKAPQERVVCVAGDSRYCTPNLSTNSAQIPKNSLLPFTTETVIPQTPPAKTAQQKGNPANHAIMRAIELVAHKRRQALLNITSITTTSKFPGDQASASGFSTPAITSPLASTPSFTPLEEYYLTSNPLKPNGYLCLNLHVYTTHEPCTMCSMALVHSRVGRVVFMQRMRHTGGLCADMHYDSELESKKVKQGESEHGDKKDGGLGYGLFWREELNWRFLCWQWRDGERVDVQPKERQDGLERDGGERDEKRDEEDVHDDTHA